MTDQELIESGTICRLAGHTWVDEYNRFPCETNLRHCTRCARKEERVWREVKQ